MGFSVTQNLYWLVDHEGAKRGQSANKLRQIALARTKMLCAHGMVGTEEDLKNTESSYQPPVKKEVILESPVVTKTEEVLEVKEEVDVKLDIKKDNFKKKK